MNKALEEKLKELDNLQEIINEYQISFQIERVAGDCQLLEARAERLAFDFLENYENNYQEEDTYFIPSIVGINQKGEKFEIPSISNITSDIIKYWTQRINATNNPVMKIRYAGLVYDFSKKVTGQSAHHSIAEIYIDALISIVEADIKNQHITELELLDHVTNQKIIRAYKVAKLINNKKRVEKIINLAIQFEETFYKDNNPSFWCFCFDLFVLEKEKCLSSEQKAKLLSNMELMLHELSSKTVKDQDPWKCEWVGLQLAKYYKSNQQSDEVKRVIEIVGNSFEKVCETADPMLASSWYEHLYSKIYMKFELNEKAKDILRKITNIGSDVIQNMKPFSHSIKIPIDELEKFSKVIVSDSFSFKEALNSIVNEFIPKKKLLEQEVLEKKNKYPLQFLFSQDLHDHKGRHLATIGSIEQDLEGNIILQLSLDMHLHSLWLRYCIETLFKKFSPTLEMFLDFFYASPIFEPSKILLLKRGLSAYLENDFISAIHILIPQIESIICTLVKIIGGDILKQNRRNGFQLKTLDDLLRDPKVEKCFGEEVLFYFRILLSDERGWNIRNNVCHGLSDDSLFNSCVADRIFHVLLSLALVREKSFEEMFSPLKQQPEDDFEQVPSYVLNKNNELYKRLS